MGGIRMARRAAGKGQSDEWRGGDPSFVRASEWEADYFAPFAAALRVNR